jgi:hypothetical protein
MSEKKQQRHRSRAEADQVAGEYEASGLTRQEFCLRNNVALKTLARYVTRYRQRRVQNPEAQKWISVELPKPLGTGCELAVVLANGRLIEVKSGFDPGTLVQLVAALERN